MREINHGIRIDLFQKFYSLTKRSERIDIQPRFLKGNDDAVYVCFVPRKRVVNTRNYGDFWFSFLVKIIFFEVIFIGFYIRKSHFFINMKENIFFFLYDFFRLFSEEFFAIDVFSDISRKALEIFLVSAGKIAVHFF